jgi:hypothetical protein
MARWNGQNRGSGKHCRYAASLVQRKRVAHIPTAETEAATSGLIFEGQRQARLYLRSGGSWSREWGAVQINLVEGFFSKLARSVLRHISVTSKQELAERVWPPSRTSTNSPSCKFVLTTSKVRIKDDCFGHMKLRDTPDSPQKRHIKAAAHSGVVIITLVTSNNL